MGAINALLLGFVGDGVKKPGSPLGTFPLDHGFQGFEPYPGFCGINVIKKTAFLRGLAPFFALPCAAAGSLQRR